MRHPIAAATLAAVPLLFAPPVRAAMESLAIESVATAAPFDTTPAPLTLEWALARAAAFNPDIAAQVAARDAANARVRPAGSLEDPRFAYEASNIPTGDWDFNSTPLSGHQLGLKQKLPIPGLLGGRRDAARAGARATDAALADRRLQVAAAVERRWADLGFAQRALAITDRNVDLLRQLAAIAETRYRVGSGLQLDVLRAQVELTALLEERLRDEAHVETASAGLAELLDLAPEETIPETASLEDASPVADLGRILADIEVRSPRLQELEARVEEARRRVRVAELESYPDVDLGVGYRVRRKVRGDTVNGDDFVSAGFTIRLPVDRGKWRARVAEASAEARRAEALFRAGRAALTARLRAAHAELVRADAEKELLQSGLLPQAEQSLESSRSAYEVGRIEFLSLLDSQVRLQNAQLQRVRALADRRAAYATLEAAAGRKLR